MDWLRDSPRSLNYENCFALDGSRKTQEGPPQEQMDGGEGNQGDGEDLGKHQVYGKGLTDVEGAYCCPTCHLGVKGMSEGVS